LPAKMLFNGLQDVTVRLYPQVRLVKQALFKLGIVSNLMSGSGPAVFGIVSSRKEAFYLSRQLKKKNKDWRIFVAKTI